MPTRFGPEPFSSHMEDVRKLYASGVSGTAIAKRYGITPVVVYRQLHRAGITLRARGSNGRPRALNKEQVTVICKRYRAGAHSRQLAAAFGVSRPTILRALRENGIHRRPANRPLGPNARYRKMTIQPTDPLFPMAGKTGYTMVHRYVMAQHLERPLLSTETVHHRNGNGLDNRLENLELRQGQHGMGQSWECADCGSRRLAPI